jgi:transcriptional regulator with XRE-family HTH domain
MDAKNEGIELGSMQPTVDAVETPGGGRGVSEAIIGELVKLRKKRKIGQEPIAKAIGITQGRVSQMENMKGGISLDAVLAYARAIGAEILVVPEGTRKKPKAISSDAVGEDESKGS